MAGRATGARSSRAGLIAAVVAVVAAVALVLAVTAFTASRTKDAKSVLGQPKTGGTGAPATTPAPIPKIKVGFVGLTNHVQSWKLPVRVKVSHGELLTVTAVDSKGLKLPGTITGSTWASSGVVIPARTYQLQVYAKGADGVSAYHTLKVTTAPPDRTIRTYVAPLTGRTVGVGFAITVQFTHPVTNRAAAEKGLIVTTSTPVVGAWHWFDSTHVHYRPKYYWPAGTKVSLREDLEAVQLSPGDWGSNHDDVNFTIGDAHVSTVNVASQHMTVTVNGRTLADYPVSTGRDPWPTRGGVHVVLEKFDSKVMDSATVGIPEFLPGPNGTKTKNPLYYKETELWATRISNGGAFVHYQPGTLKLQGLRPASHGCVNTNLTSAKQFYTLSIPGDVVNVINAKVPPNRDDPGMIDWNYTWTTWLAGSATQS